ncbi:type IV secretory system conjugative DNA transfer family protein [Roseiconus lacunae]|uniref:type IV secretory system conjugative DNA transfer family protein n=1 Tax=Roseiconus lacunae TaxID=2605694 RepID=UPI001E4101B0|nr:type IV secretory system conjugative DNA transfer family protein [Roseiconus lacunae]MCD0458677.1 type IV secretory system conjugative DNA transfer family protein [Roseiconus lacunae]
MLIADSLVEEESSGNNRHWSDTAKEMIAALCAHTATDSKYAGRRDLVTPWELSTRLSDPDPDDPHAFELETEMLRNDSAGGFVRAGARAFYSRTSDEFSSVASSVRRHLSPIGIGTVRKNLRGPATSLRRLKSGSLGIYYCMPAMRDHAMRGLKRLIVQTCLSACEAEQTQLGRQTILFLDEFHSLGRMNVMETAIAQFAGIGVKLVIVLQDLSQLKKLYPKSFETFVGNCGSIQAFSLNDDTTLSYLSKRMGETVAVSHSVNRPGRDQVIGDGASGVSFALTNTPLMTPSEIELFFARDDSQLRQLLLRPGYRPMILQRHFVYKSPYFAHKMNWEMQS